MMTTIERVTIATLAILSVFVLVLVAQSFITPLFGRDARPPASVTAPPGIDPGSDLRPSVLPAARGLTQMSTDLATRITQLRDRAAVLAAQMVSLRDERRAHSLAAVFDADKKALAIVTDADRQLDTLSKEQLTISSAIETAEALLKQQHLEAEQAERTALAVEANRCAQVVSTINIELDTMLQALREAFERRAVALGALARTGVPDVAYVNKLSNKLTATRAACAVGLHKFIDLNAVSQVSHLPLASTNTALLAIGVPPEPTSPPRSTKRKNGGDT
jgi:hypothetical protein